jgi:hypothetical protein
VAFWGFLDLGPQTLMIQELRVHIGKHHLFACRRLHERGYAVYREERQVASAWVALKVDPEFGGGFFGDCEAVEEEGFV